MALKRLTTEEMVQLSSPWVTQGSEARVAIDNVPELSGIVPRVEVAHGALHAAQPGADDPRLAALQDEAQGVDLQHDGLIRGIHMLLTALALLGGDDAAALLKLRDFLLPEGLAATQKTFRAEAGAAALLKTRLSSDAGMKKLLDETPVLKTTLTHFVDEWIERANRLGELEDTRAQLTGTSGVSDAARLLAARNGWIRAVNALVANSALAELDENTDRVIFGALRLAEKTADRRVKAPEPEAAPAPVPAPAAEKPAGPAKSPV